MSTAAVFVDLSNFYGQLLKSGIGQPDELRSYLLDWLDFDLLAEELIAEELTEQKPSVWVFYSGEKLGPSTTRIDGTYLSGYIDRINSLAGVTARDVNIGGEQRESVEVKCPDCGSKTQHEWKSEKGVDASLSVHLFDTMEHWDIAYLLSGDADFVPAVTSLRRRGKIVIGAGFKTHAKALRRECYSYVDLVDFYIKRDFLVYKIVKGGLASRWLRYDHAVDPAVPYGECAFGVYKNPASGLGVVQLWFRASKADFIDNRITELDDVFRGFLDGYEVRIEEDQSQKRWLVKMNRSTTRAIDRHLDNLLVGLRGLPNVQPWNDGIGFEARVPLKAN